LGRTTPCKLNISFTNFTSAWTKSFRFRRILNRRVEPSRLTDKQWCSCHNCVVFPSQPRENLCCQEVFRMASSPFKEVFERVKEIMENMGGLCITDHPSFRKVVLDEEVLSLLMENKRFEARNKSSTLEKIEEKRRYRYYAYRSFVLWAYGHLGLRNRLELLACVRSSIMRSFPSQDGYVGFRNSAPVEADDSYWYGSDF
ncbi:hypothetical protein ANCCAN_12666, partial [Ancylostoma caninum]